MRTTIPKSLPAIREAIDDIDFDIVTLLCKRQKLVQQAASLKSDEHSVRDPERVREVITRVRELSAQKGGQPEVVEEIYQAMISSYINYELREQRLSAKQSAEYIQTTLPTYFT